MKNPFKIYATTDAEREAVARSYAAHGIKTAEDFAAYCRPPTYLLGLLAVVLGLLAGVLLPVFVPGADALGCLVVALFLSCVGFLAGALVRFVFDHV